MVPGKEARLQFSCPVPARSEDQTGFTRQTALELKFIELRVVEAAERRRQAAECADERKLRRDDVDHETEAGFLSKLQASLGFALHVDKRIAGREKVAYQVLPRICRLREIADGIQGIAR